MLKVRNICLRSHAVKALYGENLIFFQNKLLITNVRKHMSTEEKENSFRHLNEQSKKCFSPYKRTAMAMLLPEQDIMPPDILPNDNQQLCK